MISRKPVRDQKFIDIQGIAGNRYSNIQELASPNPRGRKSLSPRKGKKKHGNKKNQLEPNIYYVPPLNSKNPERPLKYNNPVPVSLS